MLRGRMTWSVIKQILLYGIISSLALIALTISVDTYFWSFYYDLKLRKGTELFLAWPELNVLYFNTYLNKSHEWGTSPWYWYFLVAIPKSVTVALPFTLIGLLFRTSGSIIDMNILNLLSPVFIFVGLYSFLPHKELRFVFPALTLINLAGAYGLSKM